MSDIQITKPIRSEEGERSVYWYSMYSMIYLNCLNSMKSLTWIWSSCDLLFFSNNSYFLNITTKLQTFHSTSEYGVN